MHSLGKTLLVFALLHSVFQGQICLLLQVFLDFLLLHSSVAERTYPMSEVRGSGLECQAAIVQEHLRGATLHLRSGAAAGR